MPTRHAQPDSDFRQEKYCSSPEIERGLRAVPVAVRCRATRDAHFKRIVWFLQSRSWADGGLKSVSDEILQLYRDRIGSATMRKLGVTTAMICRAEIVRSIRRDFPAGYSGSFPLKGDRDSASSLLDDGDDEAFHRFWKEDTRPRSYQGKEFVEFCLHCASDELEHYLMELALNPGTSTTTGPWYFSDLLNVLAEYKALCIARAGADAVVTEIGAKITDTLDYALQSRSLVLIDGSARTGKTFSAKSWCAIHPGEARYVQVPSTNDDMSFFRAIAQALGISSSLTMKGQQMRDRVENVLQGANLLLVLDEAHYLWPQCDVRETMPHRVNWIMTALVNHGVPVALITTPQFTARQKTVVKKTGWTSEQLIGRIAHYEKLPDVLSDEDLAAVARALLPEGDARSIRTLAAYSKTSDKYLSAIEHTVKRARFLAGKEGRQEIRFGDIKAAIEGGAIPSDRGLALALGETGKREHGRPRERAISPILKADCTRAAEPFINAPGRASITHSTERTARMVEAARS